MMERFISCCFLVFFLFVATSESTSDDRKIYIVHMDKSVMPTSFSHHHEWYSSTVSSLLSSSDSAQPEHIYTYDHVMDGFSASLSRSHLEKLKRIPGHIATYVEKSGQPHTTRSTKFLGLSKDVGAWPAAGFGDDVIIGIVDSGVWPESRSFGDDGMPPVPSRWRGECESGIAFNSSNCNKKLIGARSFSAAMKRSGLNVSKIDDYDSARDFMGHGTHTSSTAAGSEAPFVSHFGYAKGTAVGVAPKARLAMYKVFFSNDDTISDASEADTLAGMDKAISDGVDVMSLSLGFIETPFYENPIALGAFAAMEKGIFVACSAGNAGPHAYTIFNGAPWITTVGAGTIDRELAADIVLGDGDKAVSVTGKSIYPESLLVSRVPIYYGYGNRSKETCDTLDPEDIAGKYIFCDSDDTESVLQMLDKMSRPASAGEDRVDGAAGAIFSTNFGQFLRPRDFNTPYVTVIPKDGAILKDYLIKTNNPNVSVTYQKTVFGTQPAPQVAYFSSRGPSRKSPRILKPDILAPGVDILAAWAPNRAAAPIGENNFLVSDYLLVSGTSMASPHIVGVAALVKATHRDWSPAAIRSAMMTSADILDDTKGNIIDMTTGIAGTPLDYGAGQVNPNKAVDPGLIYDLVAQDYINYICALNYTGEQIKMITRKSNVSCENANIDLNYPSFILILNNTNTTSFTFKRVLTNVVNSSCVYHASVDVPPGMTAVVQPEIVSFGSLYSTAEFNITVEIDLGKNPESDYFGNYGYLSWHEINGTHIVRSVIVSAIASGRP